MLNIAIFVNTFAEFLSSWKFHRDFNETFFTHILVNFPCCASFFQRKTRTFFTPMSRKYLPKSNQARSMFARLLTHVFANQTACRPFLFRKVGFYLLLLLFLFLSTLSYLKGDAHVRWTHRLHFLSGFQLLHDTESKSRKLNTGHGFTGTFTNKCCTQT